MTGDFILHDNSEYWFISAEEILNYDLAPADIPLLDKYIEISKNK